MITRTTVRVTPAQKQAAKALVQRGAKTGRHVPASVTKIANANSVSRPNAGSETVGTGTC